MKDAIDALDRFRHDGGVGNVALDELNPLAERLDIREVAGAEVVENADAIAALSQGFGDVRSDEARSTGDEELARIH